MWKADAVSFAVPGRFLVREVSVPVMPGSLLAVVGPNGAGKSTLSRMLTGELVPTAGQVRLEDRPLAGWERVALARRYAAMPQQVDIPFPMVVEEVVLLGRTPHFGWKEAAEDHAIVKECLDRVDMGGMRGRLYPTLSGGERQRVQFARALAQLGGMGGARGKYLFLDEPVSSLDLQHQHGLFRLARELARNGAGVLAVLHDLNLAASYADRILVMQRGRAVVCDVPERVLTPELIGDVFQIRALVQRHPGVEGLLVVPVPG